MKALQKGLDQLCEEGATQLFRPLRNNDLILGAVGQLQFDVVAFRLQDEYSVQCAFEAISVAHRALGRRRRREEAGGVPHQGLRQSGRRSLGRARLPRAVAGESAADGRTLAGSALQRDPREPRMSGEARVKAWLRRAAGAHLGALRLGELGVRHHGDGRVLPDLLPAVLERRRGVRRSRRFRLGIANAHGRLASSRCSRRCWARSPTAAGAASAFLLAWSLLGIAATFALYFVAQGQWAVAAALFVLGTLGFNGGVVFYDALLLDVAEPRDYDRVSALGYALGYLGGGLLFALNVLMVLKPALVRPAGRRRSRAILLLTVAIWWLVFMLPLLLFVRESSRRPRTRGAVRSRTGCASSLATARQIGRHRPLLQFLLAYWLYIDGVNTVIKMAVDYGLSLGLDESDLLGALLLTQFVAFPAAIAVRPPRQALRRARERADRPRRVRIGVTVWAYFLDSHARVLCDGHRRGAGAGRRAESVAFAVRPTGAGGQSRRSSSASTTWSESSARCWAPADGRRRPAARQHARFHPFAAAAVRRGRRAAVARAASGRSVLPDQAAGSSR